MNGKEAVVWYIYHQKFGNYTFCIGGQSGFRLSNYYKANCPNKMDDLFPAFSFSFT